MNLLDEDAACAENGSSTAELYAFKSVVQGDVRSVSAVSAKWTTFVRECRASTKKPLKSDDDGNSKAKRKGTRTDELAMLYGVANSLPDLVSTAIENGADPNAEGLTAAEKKARPDLGAMPLGIPALPMAISGGNLGATKQKLAELLIAKGADQNACADPQVPPPMAYALLFSDAAAARLLFETKVRGSSRYIYVYKDPSQCVNSLSHPCCGACCSSLSKQWFRPEALALDAAAALQVSQRLLLASQLLPVPSQSQQLPRVTPTALLGLTSALPPLFR